MGSSEALCLRWKEFESNIKSGLSRLRQNENFFDVTLYCGSRSIPAHRLVLSACSSFFRELLSSIPHHHPYVVLKGVDPRHMESLLAFMYNGEVKVLPDELDDFLFTAGELKVNGLMKDPEEEEAEEAEEEQSPVKEEPGIKREEGPKKRGRSKSFFTSPPHPPPLREENDSDIEEVGPSPKINRPLVNPPFPKIETCHEEDESNEPESAVEDTPIMTSSNEVARNDLLDAELLKYVSSRDAHTGLYKCSKCSYTSRCRLNVKKHVEARHFVTDGFKCDKCGRVFKTRETLSKHHVKVHKGESVYFSTAS